MPTYVLGDQRGRRVIVADGQIGLVARFETTKLGTKIPLKQGVTVRQETRKAIRPHRATGIAMLEVGELQLLKHVRTDTIGTQRHITQRAEFVVVQEAFAATETTAYADWLLPASTWGEKLGTVTNSERRISRVRAAVVAPGAARHDWQIGAQLARRLERHLRPSLPSLFPYDTANADAGAEAVWNEHRESTHGRDLDITGLSWAVLEVKGPQQWPMPQGASQGRQRLYGDAVFATTDGRARFDVQAWQEPAVPRDARHPFSLNTGRLRDQWHGMTRTGQLGRQFAHVSEPQLQVSPQDMQRLQLQDGDLDRKSVV